MKRVNAFIKKVKALMSVQSYSSIFSLTEVLVIVLKTVAMIQDLRILTQSFLWLTIGEAHASL